MGILTVIILWTGCHPGGIGLTSSQDYITCRPGLNPGEGFRGNLQPKPPPTPTDK